jgi:CRISPR/Cas system-associated exonuclease Cas4 (RecB family)
VSVRQLGASRRHLNHGILAMFVDAPWRARQLRDHYRCWTWRSPPASPRQPVRPGLQAELQRAPAARGSAAEAG